MKCFKNCLITQVTSI